MAKNEKDEDYEEFLQNYYELGDQIDNTLLLSSGCPTAHCGRY